MYDKLLKQSNLRRLGKYLLQYRTQGEIHNVIKRDIPGGECTFKSFNPRPRIIDAGAHIGVMTLHLKSQHPNAIITSFEPNPNTFKHLMDNIEGNGLRDVTAINAALSDKEGETTLLGNPDEETRGNSIAEHWGRDAGEAGAMRVKTVRLSDYISEPVDFLKLDVEGVEMNVLRECGEKIRNVKEMELEVHETSGCGFTVSDVLEFLVHHGFKIERSSTREISSTLPPMWKKWASENKPKLTIIRAINLRPRNI
jgi:FkbM family methyltransferase